MRLLTFHCTPQICVCNIMVWYGSGVARTIPYTLCVYYVCLLFVHSDCSAATRRAIATNNGNTKSTVIVARAFLTVFISCKLA